MASTILRASTLDTLALDTRPVHASCDKGADNVGITIERPPKSNVIFLWVSLQTNPTTLIPPDLKIAVPMEPLVLLHQGDWRPHPTTG